MLVLKRNKGCKWSARTMIRKKKKAHMDDINTNVLDEITNQEIDKLYL